MTLRRFSTTTFSTASCIALTLLGVTRAPRAWGQEAPRIVLSEIHYHPSEAQGEDAEFVELHNPSDSAVDISGWEFADGIEFEFPVGASIAPGGYAVLVKNAADFREAFGTELDVAWIYDRTLSNSGESLRLERSDGAVEFDIEYRDTSPWPIAADGDGMSLELFDVSAHGESVLDWRTGGPSPGAKNSVSDRPSGVQLAFASHTPDAPTSGQTVRVEVTVQHTEPLSRIELHLEIGVEDDAQTEMVQLRDDGAGGDRTPDDGVYSAELPAREEHTLVRYWIEAVDEDGAAARLPEERAATKNLAYYVYDDSVQTGVPLYFLILPQGRFAALLRDTSNRRFTATLVYDGVVYDRIEVRQRGAFARSWLKKSLKVIFNRDRLFEGQKRINLNSGWRDPAFLRELIAYDIHRRVGSLYSNVRVVRVHADGEFHGTFLEVEQPTDEYLDRQGLEDAVWMKADSPNNVSDERAFARAADYVVHYPRETFSDEAHEDLHAFCTKLAESQRGEENLENLLESLDIEDFINYLVANEFISNWDSFNKNHFIGHDRSGTGKWHMGPWDLDRTLGDSCSGPFDAFDQDIHLGRSRDPGCTGWNRVYQRFFEEPELVSMYYERLLTFLLDEFDEETYIAELEELVAKIGSDVDADRARWNNDSSGNVWRGGVRVVEQYIRNRKSFMLQALPGDPPPAPRVLAPENDALFDEKRVTIQTTPFVPAETGAEHRATLWQVRFDRGRWSDATDLVHLISSDQLTELEFTMLPRLNYVVRVAYLDARGKTSAFSEEVRFGAESLGLSGEGVDLQAVFNADVVANAGDDTNDPFESDDRFSDRRIVRWIRDCERSRPGTSIEPPHRECDPRRLFRTQCRPIEARRRRPDRDPGRSIRLCGNASPGFGCTELADSGALRVRRWNCSTRADLLRSFDGRSRRRTTRPALERGFRWHGLTSRRSAQ